jgi:rhomboid family GlyGly-CTERM serine protease
VDATTRLNPAGLPVGTLLICAAAGAVYGAPALQALLIYDRAAIGSGELWRLVTGNLVHHSTLHFVYNVVPLLMVGALIEFQRIRRFPALCVLSGAFIGAALHLTRPEIVVFGGLSGIVTAATAFLCLHGLDKTGPWRWLCLAVLICLAGKIGLEMALSSSFLAGIESENFVAVPESHAVGAVTALLLFLSEVLVRRVGPRQHVDTPARSGSDHGNSLKTSDQAAENGPDSRLEAHFRARM